MGGYVGVMVNSVNLTNKHLRELVVVVHIYNTSNLDAETGG